MFGRLGRRRLDASSTGPSSERPEAAATDDLLSLLQAIEAAAGDIYGRHGLPQRPGHYRRPVDGGAWEPLGEALSPAEKWALIDTAPESERWRYAAYEALGAQAGILAVRQASALLGACRGLRQRLAERAVISAQDLADSIRLGEAWRRLVEEAGHEETPSPPLKFLPPDEAD